jgi:hypothetical protein
MSGVLAGALAQRGGSSGVCRPFHAFRGGAHPEGTRLFEAGWASPTQVRGVIAAHDGGHLVHPLAVRVDGNDRRPFR